MTNTPKYLDNASSTKVDQRVIDSMLPYFNEMYGNASSNHFYGKQAKSAIETSREQAASLINSNYKEIIFTSGATESVNMALKGITEQHIDKGNHIITVKTEHKAVLSTCEYLETKGYEITYLNVDKNGVINLGDLKNSIKPSTILVSVMYVNNETGIIQAIPEIGEICRNNNVYFFCDATQAVGKVEVNVEKDNIDMLCMSAHKLNGPKGIGVLYLKTGVELSPLIHGGSQESGLRAGTLNTPLIVGLGKACELAKYEFEINNQEYCKRRLEIENYYEENDIGIVNFKKSNTVHNIISITLNNFDAETFLMMNSKKIAASTGSACNQELIEPSHVLRALNIPNIDKIIRISI